jgi:hypothetical protein
MKFRTLAAAAAALSLTAAPVVAQAAPARASAPVEQGSDLHGNWLLAILAIAAIIAGIIIATKGHNNPVSP